MKNKLLTVLLVFGNLLFSSCKEYNGSEHVVGVKSYTVSTKQIQELTLGMTQDEIIQALGMLPIDENEGVWRFNSTDDGIYYLNFFEVADKGKRLRRVYHVNFGNGDEVIIIESKDPIKLFDDVCGGRGQP